ncbi:MAG: hypothetical protein US14_C0045G0001, partial [candidate division WS6 bacterium GW2011_WS6_36_26]
MFCVTRNTVSQSQNQFYSIERPTYKEKETMKTSKLLGLVLTVMLLLGTLTACDWHWPWWQPETSTAESNGTSESINVNDGDTYLEEYSCTDLPSCTTKIVPAGTTTIGYKHTGVKTCDFFIYHEGESISYKQIDEFHTYPNALPALTNDSDFARSQVYWIYACNH